MWPQVGAGSRGRDEDKGIWEDLWQGQGQAQGKRHSRRPYPLQIAEVALVHLPAVPL